MFREMRRNTQLLSEARTLEVLENGIYGVLSVAGDDGYPYGVPVNYYYDNGAIYIHSAVEGHKVDAIKANPKVSFTVVEKSDYVASELTTYFRSVIAFGKAEIIADPDEKMRVLVELSERFSHDYPELIKSEVERLYDKLHMVKIVIDHVTGKEAKELVQMR